MNDKFFDPRPWVRGLLLFENRALSRVLEAAVGLAACLLFFFLPQRHRGVRSRCWVLWKGYDGRKPRLMRLAKLRMAAVLSMVGTHNLRDSSRAQRLRQQFPPCSTFHIDGGSGVGVVMPRTVRSFLNPGVLG